jgi:DNA-binding Xre family transcriptional regulator
MIISTIQDAARVRGMENASQLAREAMIHPFVAYKLWSGEFVRLDLVTLDRLCAALECQPGQLFKFESANGNGSKKRGPKPAKGK